MLRSSLSDYGDTLMRTAAVPNNNKKKIISKNCAPFTDCIRGINSKETDHSKDIDVVMPNVQFNRI